VTSGFGVPTPGGSIFGSSVPLAAPSGVSLFNSTTPLFNQQTSQQSGTTHGNYGEQSDGEDKEEGDEGQGGSDDQAENSGDEAGDKNKPVKLNIESRPPEKSPYEKIFSSVSYLIYFINCAIEPSREVQGDYS
jgi:hypothetical protein